VLANPVKGIDPQGLTLVDWVLTGEWNPAPNVRAAAERGIRSDESDIGGRVIWGATKTVVNITTQAADGVIVGGSALVGIRYDADDYAKFALSDGGKGLSESKASGEWSVEEQVKDFAVTAVMAPVEVPYRLGEAIAKGDWETAGEKAYEMGLIRSGAKMLQNRLKSPAPKGGPNPGGRLGGPKTREHVEAIADEMEGRGWTIEGGGGRMAEEYLPGPGGARVGSSYPDITATKNGRTLRVNTVDTLKDGVTPTARETRNATRIRQQKPEDKLLLVPKPKS
jgi:hypothetical protein